MENTETLNFYTTGDGFTNLLHGFIDEGRISAVYDTLKGGGLPPHLIRSFFLNGVSFEGTTKNGGDLSVLTTDTVDTTRLIQSLISLSSEMGYEITELNDMLKSTHNKNINTLISLFGDRYLMGLLRGVNQYTISILRNNGYSFTPYDKLTEDISVFDGVILEDGSLVECGYMEHSHLYPLLYSLGLCSEPDWTDCKTIIHISSCQISGPIGNSLGDDDWGGKVKATENQLKALHILRGSINSKYAGYSQKLCNYILYEVEHTENFGGKWNNLQYLKKYRNDINTPLISKTELIGVRNCIRTSPKYSIPGLLNSYFDIDDTTISKITERFDRFKDVIKGNELNVFYQQYMDGKNGVLHYDANGFSYSVSDTRGDVVGGIATGLKLDSNVEYELNRIGKSLYDNFNTPVQLEFVVDSDNIIYIVQFRLLKNGVNSVIQNEPPSNSILIGNSFTEGCIDVNISDILVVDSDGESELLIGKKALIVKESVEFSHLLALSRALRIPSIYGVTKFELPESGIVQFNTKNKNGYVKLIKQLSYE